MSAVTRIASGVTTSQMMTTKSLTSSIVQLDSIFSKAKFTNFPKMTWIKGVSTSVLSFVDLMKKISSSIVSVMIGSKSLNLIVSSILKLDKDLSKGKFNKFPDIKWVSGVNTSLSSFVSLMKKISSSFVSVLIGGKSLDLITLSILKLDKELSKGKFTKFPPQNWMTSVGSIAVNFAKIIDKLNKSISIASLTLGTLKLYSIISSIVKTSKLISAGLYDKVPSLKWIDSVSRVSMMFGSLAMRFDKQFGIVGLLAGLYKIKKVSDTIREISGSLNRGNYAKFPPLEWAKGVVASLNGFLNLKLSVSSIMDLLVGKAGSPDSKKMKVLLDNILTVDKTFSKGSFKNFPSDAWSGGIIKTLGRFSTIMKMIDLTSIGSKMAGSVNFKSITSNLEILARSFDKLGDSVQKFSESINVIDDKKLNSIRTLTSNVVLLSLMDSTQFEKMMQKLEQNSAIFNKLLSDSKPKSGAGNVVGPKSSSVQLSEVKTPGRAGSIEMKKPDENIQMMQNLVAVLTDIASVVGSRGKLKEYLEEKDSVTTQAFNWFGGS